MAISPIAGMVYANQGMQAPATQQAEFQQRLDAQAAAAMVASNEEKQEIEEVRPTEETLEMDPEKEHERQTADEEEGEEDKKANAEEAILEEEKEKFTSGDEEDHLLDITI